MPSLRDRAQQFLDALEAGLETFGPALSGPLGGPLAAASVLGGLSSRQAEAERMRQLGGPGESLAALLSKTEAIKSGRPSLPARIRALLAGTAGPAGGVSQASVFRAARPALGVPASLEAELFETFRVVRPKHLLARSARLIQDAAEATTPEQRNQLLKRAEISAALAQAMRQARHDAAKFLQDVRRVFPVRGRVRRVLFSRSPKGKLVLSATARPDEPAFAQPKKQRQEVLIRLAPMRTENTPRRRIRTAEHEGGHGFHLLAEKEDPNLFDIFRRAARARDLPLDPDEIGIPIMQGSNIGRLPPGKKAFLEFISPRGKKEFKEIKSESDFLRLLNLGFEPTTTILSHTAPGKPTEEERLAEFFLQLLRPEGQERLTAQQKKLMAPFVKPGALGPPGPPRRPPVPGR